MIGSSSLTLPAVLSIACFLGQTPQQAEGHAYMMGPVSRNLWATDAFQDSDFPGINYCPHCFQSRGPAAVRARAEDKTDPLELELYGGGQWPHFSAYERGELASNGNYYEPDEIAVRHGICGDPEQTAAEGSNLYGQENSNYPVLETFAEGSVMEVKVVMSTYHWGHLELFICNANDMSDPDGVVTQGCFNMHPLDRASDDGDASPIDPNHRGRYFVDPTCRAQETDQTLLPGAFLGDVVTARYQLPEGLTCSRCIVQMVYYTGNSCKHPGYDEFNPSSWPSDCAPTKDDWIATGLGMCGDGDVYPEEFWNCADIAITAGGAPSNPSPSPPAQPVEQPTQVTPFDEGTSGVDPASTPAPVPAPTPAPVRQPLEEPTSEPTYKPVYNEATPAPSADKSTDEPTPGPKTFTRPPATFAPSVVAPEAEVTCDDPVGAYGQCGGDDSYDGPTCCRSGYECEKLADCFSECRPMDGGCSEGWGQCGGRDWDGPTCCWPGAECLERNEWYSQCVPEMPN